MCERERERERERETNVCVCVCVCVCVRALACLYRIFIYVNDNTHVGKVWLQIAAPKKRADGENKELIITFVLNY